MSCNLYQLCIWQCQDLFFSPVAFLGLQERWFFLRKNGFIPSDIKYIVESSCFPCFEAVKTGRWVKVTLAYTLWMCIDNSIQCSTTGRSVANFVKICNDIVANIVRSNIIKLVTSVCLYFTLKTPNVHTLQLIE